MRQQKYEGLNVYFIGFALSSLSTWRAGRPVIESGEIADSLSAILRAFCTRRNANLPPTVDFPGLNGTSNRDLCHADRGALYKPA